MHQRLVTPIDKPGAMTLFGAPAEEHLSFARHLCAERRTEEFVVGKGVVTRWETVRRNNHWLDALYNACAAGHFCGVRLLTAELPEPEPRPLPAKREREDWLDIREEQRRFRESERGW